MRHSMSAFVLLVSCGATAAVKIDSIQTCVTKDGLSFVQVRAGNLTGWGQCSYNNEQTDLSNTTADKVHDWVGSHVLGESVDTPDDIAYLSDKVWRKNYKRTGTLLARALAGVDTALWDLIGRAQNVSVCSLVAQSLGSTCKARVPVYGSNGDRSKSPDDIVGNAVHNREDYGIHAYKFQIMDRMGQGKDIKPNRTEELIPLARQMLGPNVTLMADANGGFANATQAMAVARLMEENNFTWLEEPFPFWQYDDTAELQRQFIAEGMKLRVALGEQEYRLDIWKRQIGDMQFAQPDVHYVGGFTRALRVARLSMAANTTFVPHSPNPSMIDVFARVLIGAVPNAFGFMEFDAINTHHPPDGTDWFTEKVYKIEDGAMEMPTGPGWGVTFKPGVFQHAFNRTTSH